MSRQYTDEFKRKIAELKMSGKPTKEIVEEYNISKSSISTWEQQYKNSGKFTVKDNLTEGEKELKVLRKQNQQLKMENDILK